MSASITAEFHGSLLAQQQALEESAKMVEKVRVRYGRMGLVWDLWSLYRKLKKDTDSLHDFERKWGVVELDISSIRNEVIDGAASAESLHSALSNLINKARRAGFAKATITGAVIDAIKAVSEAYLDYADLLRVSADDQVDVTIREARDAWDRGETYKIG